MRSIGPCMTRCATLLSHAFNILIIQICGTLGSHNYMLDTWIFFFFGGGGGCGGGGVL
jgi:hypothetical protein